MLSGLSVFLSWRPPLASASRGLTALFLFLISRHPPPTSRRLRRLAARYSHRWEGRRWRGEVVVSNRNRRGTGKKVKRQPPTYANSGQRGAVRRREVGGGWRALKKNAPPPTGAHCRLVPPVHPDPLPTSTSPIHHHPPTYAVSGQRRRRRRREVGGGWRAFKKRRGRGKEGSLSLTPSRQSN